MVEESLDFQSFEKHQNASYFLLHFWVNTFTILEDNFDFKSSKIIQNAGFLLGFWAVTFTMVEENFDFQSSKMLQNEGL